MHGAAAIASVVYTYANDNYDNFSNPTSYLPSMSVTASLELTSALGSNLESHWVGVSDIVKAKFNDGVYFRLYTLQIYNTLNFHI